jgi:UDP-N-acetylmuramoyl-L-alanyl-D-glutamate--2,6-diaminopimelate ligase
MSFRRVVKAFIPRKLFRKVEPYGHLSEAVLLNTINGFPGRGLKVIGVTGTNGKTTTCFLIHRMMLQAGYKVGLMTTVAYGAGSEIRPQVQHMTNVTVPELMKRLKWMKSQSVEWLVLETTSHALAQHRTWGVPYSLAVMTNVTHEHLDYHGSFERYRDAKRMLFKQTNNYKKGLRTGIINADDPSAELFVKDVATAVTYGVKNGQLRAKKIKSTPSGSSYKAEFQGQIFDIKTNLPGSFNVYNSLAAVGAGIALGIEHKHIEQGIAALDAVEGRMTRLNEGQSFDVIVDFAHTPDSFEKLFADLKPVVKGKMIVMFGSAGGQRDPAKRPIQGEISGKYADEVVLTEEDDRDTPGVDILNQIAAGAEKAGKVRNKDLFLVHDRTEAIKFAISRAKRGDILLLLGKGHEKTIERADGEHPWDEIATAKKALK